MIEIRGGIMKHQPENKPKKDLDNLEEFIDNWDNFESRHVQKREKQITFEETLEFPEKKKNWWKWLVASRYRAISKDIYENQKI